MAAQSPPYKRGSSWVRAQPAWNQWRSGTSGLYEENIMSSNAGDCAATMAAQSPSHKRGSSCRRAQPACSNWGQTQFISGARRDHRAAAPSHAALSSSETYPRRQAATKAAQPSSPERGSGWMQTQFADGWDGKMYIWDERAFRMGDFVLQWMQAKGGRRFS